MREDGTINCAITISELIIISWPEFVWVFFRDGCLRVALEVKKDFGPSQVVRFAPEMMIKDKIRQPVKYVLSNM